MGRQRTSTRAKWSEEALVEAMKNIISKEMGVNEASRKFGIPSRTLRRHIETGKLKMSLGRPCELTIEHERLLVKHIKSLVKANLAPDRTAVKIMAYEFAEKLQIKHRFSQKHKAAGNEWYNAFVRRNKDLSLHQPKGSTKEKVQLLKRSDELLLPSITIENKFIEEPCKIFHIQDLNDNSNNTLPKKTSKEAFTQTTSENEGRIKSCCHCSCHRTCY